MKENAITPFVVELDQKFKCGGFQFEILLSHDNFYILQVVDGAKVWFEVWRKRTTPVCIDFEKKIFSAGQHKEVKPKARDFGTYAWTCGTMAHAQRVVERESKKLIEREPVKIETSA